MFSFQMVYVMISMMQKAVSNISSQRSWTCHARRLAFIDWSIVGKWSVIMGLGFASCAKWLNCFVESGNGTLEGRHYGKKDCNETKIIIPRKSTNIDEQCVAHTFQRFCGYKSGIEQSCELSQPWHSFGVTGNVFCVVHRENGYYFSIVPCVAFSLLSLTNKSIEFMFVFYILDILAF